METLALAGWFTPKLPSGGACPRNIPGGGLRKLEDQAELFVWTGSGANGTPAQTEKPAGYRLNPLFFLWLMGYPVEWHCLGE